MLLCVRCPFCGYRSAIEEDDLAYLGATRRTPVANLLSKVHCEVCGGRPVQVRWDDDDDGLAFVAQRAASLKGPGGSADGGRAIS